MPTLAKALGIGLLACMLNPHHVGVWQLPFELVGAKEVSADPRLRSLLYTPLDRQYTDNAVLGYNVNGLAFAVLIDATVVRMVLVPAVMELLGDRSWWLPRWLDRSLPRVTIEAPRPRSVDA